MTVADVGSLDKRHAILLSAGRRPVLLELMPWYREGDAETISAHAAEATARELSIPVLRLDTNRALPEAMQLYRASGWTEIPRFNDDPYPDTFFEKRL